MGKEHTHHPTIGIKIIDMVKVTSIVDIFSHKRCLLFTISISLTTQLYMNSISSPNRYIYIILGLASNSHVQLKSKSRNWKEISVLSNYILSFLQWYTYISRYFSDFDFLSSPLRYLKILLVGHFIGGSHAKPQLLKMDFVLLTTMHVIQSKPENAKRCFRTVVREVKTSINW